MDEKVYRIYKTKQFAYQFDDIGFYIAESAGAPEPALDYMRRVEEAVSKLAYSSSNSSSRASCERVILSNSAI